MSTHRSRPSTPLLASTLLGVALFVAIVPPAYGIATRLQFSPIGETAADEYGYSVASAGDVNADGFADFIAGAPNQYTGGTNAGHAYLYFGGPGADAIADLTLAGEAVPDQFGLSVASAGDFNGDGYGDIVIGAPSSDGGGIDAGRVYVFFGGVAPNSTPDLILTGDAAGDFFGFSVSSAGDVNGDSFADVIVGAFGNDAGGSTAGRAYVFFGGSAPNAVADLTLTGESGGDNFGFSVATAGDINGDRFGDVIVGAQFYDVGAGAFGRAYLYFGGAAPNAVADLTVTGEVSGDRFGHEVAPAGDVNADGFADVVVGAVLNSAGGASAGRAYIFFGGAAPNAIADLTLTGESAGDQFGVSVNSAGDVNGDGFADLIVGANMSDAGGVTRGRAYIYFGGVAPNDVADLTLSGETAGDQFGFSVASARDVNGDGFPDLIIGAPQNDAGGANAGRAYVYDVNRYLVLSPNGGETWDVGAIRTISWRGEDPADAWLSVDGGFSYQLLETGVGGAALNAIAIRVPHVPTKFARVKLTASDASIRGHDASDSLFTVRTSVALLALLAAPAPNGARGAVISWQTDPGPEDLAGYRLEHALGGANDWSTVVSLTRETSYADPSAGPATRYRLFAVNGLGEELLLGETSFRPAAPIAAWPLPYRGGNLSIAFATHGAIGGGPGNAEVSLYDVSGRLVRTVARGHYTAGYQAAIWDGRDAQGNRVASGVYFLRATSAGEDRVIKFVVAH